MLYFLLLRRELKMNFFPWFNQLKLDIWKFFKYAISHTLPIYSLLAIYVEDIEDSWYKNPDQYMLQIKDASQKLFAHKENDVIELEISGQKLLEAL